jgi:hypothetical protein
MDTPTTRISRPSRIVALVLIALAMLGLAYLRYGPGDRAVSVPSGAKAGDLTLESCEYATDSGSNAADCGTPVMPANRADPQSRLITLPVGHWLRLAFRFRPGLGLGCHLSFGHAFGGAAISCDLPGPLD